MPGFEAFFYGWQQDLKLAIVPPILCAVFRLFFIYLDVPKKLCEWPKQQLKTCFRYGFWWGMDINTRYYLVSLVIATLPSFFFNSYYYVSDDIRLAWFGIFLLIMYIAFVGKLLFYYHFNDIYNRNMWLGKNADKKNLLDIFFNQNKGGWILLGIIPYMLLVAALGVGILSTPTVHLPHLPNSIAQIGLEVGIFLSSIAVYYWFNFGGTFRHRLKPEWDEVPPEVKHDVFLGKATVDDLVALKMVWKHPVPAFMDKDEQTMVADIQKLIPEFKGEAEENPLHYLKHVAKGPKLKKPKHIFYILEESHCQLLYDEIYDMLEVTKYTKKLRRETNAFVVNNFQPAGMISQTALGSILLGIYDCDMELNEKREIWNCNLSQIPTNLAGQMKKLGYRTHFWYGGSLNWGSLMHFAPAVGFDQSLGGPDFCPQEAPQTWLGVYDHIFLDEVAKKIQSDDDGTPEFHFVYTTSNHGPYNIPYESYGIHEEDAVKLPLGRLKQGDQDMRRFTGILYADKAIADFVERMRQVYPDSMFILTADHSTAVCPFDKGILPRQDCMLREKILTSFSLHHPELEQEWFAGNNIGEHQNILPTIMELIAPKGFEYYSLKNSLLEKIDYVVTPYSWMNQEQIGYYKDDVKQQLSVSENTVVMERGDMQYESEHTAIQSVTGWMLQHAGILAKD